MDLDSVKKEMDELGVEYILKTEAEKLLVGQLVCHVEVDIDTDVDYTKVFESDFVMRKLTGRKDTMYIQFGKRRDGTVTMGVMQAMPVKQFDISKSNMDNWIARSENVATTFPDLCWYHSDGTTQLTMDEVMTVMREGADFGDLTWFLPSRFIDNFIEIMHTLNQSLLLGLMQDSIIYGPFYNES